MAPTFCTTPPASLLWTVPYGSIVKAKTKVLKRRRGFVLNKSHCYCCSCCCFSQYDNPAWLSPISLLTMNYKHNPHAPITPFHLLLRFIPDPPASLICYSSVCACVCEWDSIDWPFLPFKWNTQMSLCFSTASFHCHRHCVCVCACWCLHFSLLTCGSADPWQTNTNDLLSHTCTHTQVTHRHTKRNSSSSQSPI